MASNWLVLQRIPNDKEQGAAFVAVVSCIEKPGPARLPPHLPCWLPTRLSQTHTNGPSANDVTCGARIAQHSATGTRLRQHRPNKARQVPVCSAWHWNPVLGWRTACQASARLRTRHLSFMRAPGRSESRSWLSKSKSPAASFFITTFKRHVILIFPYLAGRKDGLRGEVDVSDLHPRIAHCQRLDVVRVAQEEMLAVLRGPAVHHAHACRVVDHLAGAVVEQVLAAGVLACRA